MKHRKYFRAAVLVLAMMLVLSMAACGDSGSGNQPQSGGSMQDYQPPVTTSSNNLNEPDAKNPLADSAGITGIWRDGPAVFVFYYDFAMLYEFGSAEDNDLRFGYLKNLYDCSYTLNGNTLSLSAYEMDGTLVFSSDYTLEESTLRDEYNEFVKVSNNTGTEEQLSGTWYTMGDEFELCWSSMSGTGFKGRQMRFYDDGTCCSSWEDGSGLYAGKYSLTTKYDLPAITFYDEYGYEKGTYPYEFLANDLLMIYVYDVDFGGFTFYRAS